MEENESPAEVVEETAAAPVEVAEHVSEAATEASEVAEATGEDGWKVVAEELKGLRGDIKKLMKGTVSAAGHAAQPAAQPSPSTAPDVEVEVPKPPERKVRRGNRKVTRRG